MIQNIINSLFGKKTGSSRQRFMSRLSRGNKKNDWFSVLHNVRIEILAASWNSARTEKLTMKQTFEKLTNKCFELLDIIALEMQYEIKTIGLTSLWRPGNPNYNVHSVGRGIDLGYVIARGGWKYMFHQDFTAGEEPELLKQLRIIAWNSELLWQWIGPHYIKYEVEGAWIKNSLSGDIQKNHKNHVHLTIGV